MSQVGLPLSSRGPHFVPATFRKLSTATAAVALAGISACSPPAHAPAASDLVRLRMCESGGNYAIDTGNGYSGAYQFAAGTWHALGFGGMPHQAASWIQDMAVIRLWQQRGWAPWPGCAASLGLR